VHDDKYLPERKLRPTGKFLPAESVQLEKFEISTENQNILLPFVL